MSYMVKNQNAEWLQFKTIPFLKTPPSTEKRKCSVEKNHSNHNMKNSNVFLQFLSNVQILSALIWAFTIIACSWVSDKSILSSILITAAGFHVILLTHFEKKKSKNKEVML